MKLPPSPGDNLVGISLGKHEVKTSITGWVQMSELSPDHEVARPVRGILQNEGSGTGHQYTASSDADVRQSADPLDDQFL